MKQKVLAIAARLWDLRYWIPLTPLGMAVVGTSVWVHAHYGTGRLDYVVYAAARVALLMVAAAVFLVLAAAVVLMFRLRGSRGIVDLELESGVRAATGFSFPRFIAWPMVQVKLRWARPKDVWATLERTGRSLQEVVTPRRRGRVSEVKRRFMLSDIFGLSRFGLPRVDPQRVRIAPGRATATGSTLLHFAGGEGLSHPSGPAVGELLDMRGYSYGDPLKHLLWKAYARTRQLLVRTAERATYPTPSAMAYFVCGQGDEPTASIARFFLEQRLLGEDFIFIADGAEGPTSDANEAVEQIIASVRHVGAGASGLGRFVEHAEQWRGRHLVLFVPPSRGAWLDRVTALGGRLKGATAILSIDDDLRARQRSSWRRLAFGGAPPQPHGAKSLAQIRRALEAQGMHLTVLHRPSGEIVPVSRLEALA